eukprot:scaffold11_cov257-Pinguiococcus_pyrenoidosus.AAC.20
MDGIEQFSVVNVEGDGVNQLHYEELHFHDAAGNSFPLPQSDLFRRLPFIRYDAPQTIQVRSVRNYKIKISTYGRHPGVVRLWRLVLPRLRNDEWSWKVVEEVFGPMRMDDHGHRRDFLFRVNQAIEELPGINEIRAQWLNQLRHLAYEGRAAPTKSERDAIRDEAVRMLEVRLMQLTRRIRSSREHAAMLITGTGFDVVPRQDFAGHGVLQALSDSADTSPEQGSATDAEPSREWVKELLLLADSAAMVGMHGDLSRLSKTTKPDPGDTALHVGPDTAS